MTDYILKYNINIQKLSLGSADATLLDTEQISNCLIRDLYSFAKKSEFKLTDLLQCLRLLVPEVPKDNVVPENENVFRKRVDCMIKKSRQLSSKKRKKFLNEPFTLTLLTPTSVPDTTDTPRKRNLKRRTAELLLEKNEYAAEIKRVNKELDRT